MKHIYCHEMVMRYAYSVFLAHSDVFPGEIFKLLSFFSIQENLSYETKREQQELLQKVTCFLV